MPPLAPSNFSEGREPGKAEARATRGAVRTGCSVTGLRRALASPKLFRSLEVNSPEGRPYRRPPEPSRSRPERPPQNLEHKLRLLLTSATSELGRTVAALLAPDHDLALTDLDKHAEDAPGVTRCDLGDDEATDRMVEGLDAIVHIGYGGHFASASDLIDLHTRCTYNLLTAARSAGVARLINLSTLRLLADYPPYLTVTENWRPMPEVEPLILAAHLCEYVCREFGREGGIEIANLRLGFPLVRGDTEAAAAAGESAALAEDDLRDAVNAALVVDLAAGAQSANSPAPASFRTVHVQSPIPDARFLLNGASSVLGLWEGRGAA